MTYHNKRSFYRRLSRTATQTHSKVMNQWNVQTSNAGFHMNSSVLLKPQETIEDLVIIVFTMLCDNLRVVSAGAAKWPSRHRSLRGALQSFGESGDERVGRLWRVWFMSVSNKPICLNGVETATFGSDWKHLKTCYCINTGSPFSIALHHVASRYPGECRNLCPLWQQDLSSALQTRAVTWFQMHELKGLQETNEYLGKPFICPPIPMYFILSTIHWSSQNVYAKSISWSYRLTVRLCWMLLLYRFGWPFSASEVGCLPERVQLRRILKAMASKCGFPNSSLSGTLPREHE